MRGTIDVFTFLLFLGIFLILVFALLFGGISEIGLNLTNVTTTTTITTTTVSVPKGVLVGKHEVKTWRRVDLGYINISHISHEKSITSERKKIFNGLLFGSEELVVHVNVDNETLRGAKIVFKVVNTNNYGRLRVYLNDMLMNEGYYAVGEYELEVDLSRLKKENKVRFAVESSGWKLWAPAIYELEDAGLLLFSKDFIPTQREFFLYSAEVERLTRDKGYLTLDLTTKQGNLTVKLNDEQIFYGAVNRSFFQVLFDQSVLRVGKNEVEFLPEENSRFEGQASLIFYYTIPKEEKASLGFEINETTLGLLNKTSGKVRFEVVEVLRTGGIKVSIGNEEREVTIGYEKAAEGNYSFSFGGGDVRLGRNYVRISAVDDALFYLNDLRVELPS